MRIVVCWTDLSGYVAACFRALAAQKEIELLVLLFAPRKELDQAFTEDLLRGLNVRLLKPAERDDAELVHSIVVAHNPQVIVVPGWLHPPYKQLATLPEFGQSRFIMTMDNPWKSSLRQRLGRFKVGGYLKRMNAIFVAGERAWQFAQQLGVPETKIYRGVYGFDLPAFAGVYEKRLARGPWPRRFLFMGRYVTVKGLDYLLPAYEEEGKSHLTVAIGCTGGRHRSVVIAEHLAREYQARGDFMVEVVHRDVEKPPHRP